MAAPVGRPRDQTVEAKVVASTFDLLNEEGLGGLSVEGIATRAGVSKATIYRRWDSKEELLVDAFACVVEEVTVPDSGDIREDLVAAVRAMWGFVCDSRAGEVFPWLVGEIASGSQIGRRYAAAVIRPRREMLSGLIGRAVQRGDLRADLDVDLAVDMITGAVVIRRMLGQFDQTPQSWPESLVDTLLAGWS
ncbi:MAG: TetR/AcrR family transcriptional regulator [Acidimicrobiia bacterium]